MFNKILNIKRLAILILLSNFIVLSAQTNDVESFFKKYSEGDGITSMNFSPGPGAMESAANASQADKEVTDMMKNIKTVKILTSKKSKAKVNLYDEALKSVNFKDWEQYLEVKEDDKKVKMYYKPADNKKVKEFLLIVSEENESSLIWISGLIDLKDISKIQSMMGKGDKNQTKYKTK